MNQGDFFNRSLSPNKKIKYFLGAWLLSTLVLNDSLVKFLNTLDSQSIIQLPEDFSAISIVWGDGIVLNIIKLSVAGLSAFAFGIIYTYLSRKLTLRDKVNLSFTNAFVTVFGGPIFFILIFLTFYGSDGYSFFNVLLDMRNSISQNTSIKFMIVIQLAIVLLFTFLGIIYAESKTKYLPEEKGKLLGVKWYHFLWLSPALSIYLQSIYGLVYLSIKAVVAFIQNFNLGDIFGLAEKTSETEANSLSGLFWTLFILYMVAYLISRLTIIQREVLDSNVHTNKLKAITISILFALIIPILLLVFTFIGDGNA